MELRRYIQILQGRFGLIAVITLLVAGVSFGIGALLPAVYQASTSLLVNAGGSTGATYSDVLANERLATTYSELLTKRPVIETAARELGLDPNQVEKKVRVRLVPDTTIIELTAEDSDPRRAAEIANRVVAAFKGNARELGVRERDLIVIEPAAVPAAPARNTMIYAFLGAFAGFVFSLGLVFLFEYLNDAIETTADIQSVPGLAPLGAVPRFRRSEQTTQLIALTQPHASMAEAYRSIRTQLHHASADRPLKKLLVTSAEPATGKTTLAANLGVALAQTGSRVVLIDANAHGPALHRFFDVQNTAGLTGWLSSHVRGSEACLMKTAIDNLQVIPSGPLPPDPSALLGSARMDALLEEIAQHADWIILDAPAALTFTDAIVLAGNVDGVVLAIEARRTSRQAVHQVCAALQSTGATILGAALTKSRERSTAQRRLTRLRERDDPAQDKAGSSAAAQSTTVKPVTQASPQSPLEKMA